MGKQNNSPLCLESLGKRITALMQEKGINQTELAEMVGLTQPAVSRIVTGERILSAPELAALSSVFGVSADYLLGLVPSAGTWQQGAPASSVCRILQRWLDAGLVKAAPVTIQENVYMQEGSSYYPSRAQNQYTAFYFPGYSSLDGAMEEGEAAAVRQCYERHGNASEYAQAVNRFISHLVRLHDACRAGSIDREEYAMLVSRQLHALDKAAPSDPPVIPPDLQDPS